MSEKEPNDIETEENGTLSKSSHHIDPNNGESAKNSSNLDKSEKSEKLEKHEENEEKSQVNEDNMEKDEKSGPYRSKESPLTDIATSPPSLDFIRYRQNTGAEKTNSYESSELSDLGDEGSEAETDKMSFLEENTENNEPVSDLLALSELTELARLKDVDSDDFDEDLEKKELGILEDKVPDAPVENSKRALESSDDKEPKKQKTEVFSEDTEKMEKEEEKTEDKEKEESIKEENGKESVEKGDELVEKGPEIAENLEKVHANEELAQNVQAKVGSESQEVAKENDAEVESAKKSDENKLVEDRDAGEDAEQEVEEDVEEDVEENDEDVEEENEENEEKSREDDEDDDEEDVNLNEQRKLAIADLIHIEELFASLRDKLYQDKLSLLERELQLCLEGSHPELSKIYHKVNGFYQESLKLANFNLSYKLKCIDKETIATRTSIHQDFLKNLMDSKNDMITETTSLWYKINKERNQLDQLVPDYSYAAIPLIEETHMNGYENGHEQPQPLTKKAIKQNTLVELVQQHNNRNHQLGVLNGLVQFHGFPCAINTSLQEVPAVSSAELLLKKATDEEIMDDLRDMGIPI